MHSPVQTSGWAWIRLALYLIVSLVLLLGLAMVNIPVPEASGAREIFDIIYTPLLTHGKPVADTGFFCASI